MSASRRQRRAGWLDPGRCRYHRPFGRAGAHGAGCRLRSTSQIPAASSKGRLGRNTYSGTSTTEHDQYGPAECEWSGDDAEGNGWSRKDPSAGEQGREDRGAGGEGERMERVGEAPVRSHRRPADSIGSCESDKGCNGDEGSDEDGEAHRHCRRLFHTSRWATGPELSPAVVKPAVGDSQPSIGDAGLRLDGAIGGSIGNNGPVATTAESLHDLLIWSWRLLLVSLKRAAIIGVFIGLFVLAIWATDRDPFGDCRGVTPEQRDLLNSFREPAPGRSFQAISEPVCWRGAIATTVRGLEGSMDEVIEQLDVQGWEMQANLWPFQYDLRVACFRPQDGRWQQVELNVSSSRAGTIARAELRATNSQTACEPFDCGSITTGCQRWDRLEVPT